MIQFDFMISDVPVGVLLSGGLDSSSYFSKFKKKQVRNIQSFNIGFRDEEHNESHLARMLSEKLGYGFNTLQLEDEALYSSLLQATYFQDEHNAFE
jgi:asparagine synthase (glutamine-hydrolysing)